MQDAIDYGKALMKMYPSFDLIPFMIAYIYYQKDFPQEALQVAVDAIPRCPRKYRSIPWQGWQNSGAVTFQKPSSGGLAALWPNVRSWTFRNRIHSST
jgi:hypothetical protein